MASQIVNGQDPVVTDLAKYFNEAPQFQHRNPKVHLKPELLTQWRLSRLTAAEIELIEKEYFKCARDFRYAARNYFYIVDKKSNENLFQLWESQELILEKIAYMRSIQRPAKIIVLKARQLGISLLTESMIAWRAMFSKNINALVVSYDQEHAEYLYGLMQHIYDRMPWWLKPSVASRKMDTGLWFDNPDPGLRGTNPGLNSHVYVEWANKMSGVGMGKRLNAAHISEYSEFKHLKKIVEQDMTHALAVDDPGFFAILESTAKGTGHYSYKLWKANVEAAEKAEWLPVFMPWFFESNRKFVIPSGGWVPDKEDLAVRDRAMRDWVRCDNQECLQYEERFFMKMNKTDTLCSVCRSGHLRSFEIADEQLIWMSEARKNAKMKGEDSLRKLKQELAATAEEAFQSSGIQIFSSQVLDYVGSTLEKDYLQGFFDEQGNLHGKLQDGSCVKEGCTQDHTHEEALWRIWRKPAVNGQYVAGVDVSEGLELDDSVIFINKVAKGSGTDEQVATYINNKLDPMALAREAVKGAKYYNHAMLAIERNAYGVCNSDAANVLLYPNMYKPRHVTNSGTGVYRATGWLTSPMTKPWLTNQARRWLKAEIWKLRDPILLEQLKTFQKEDESTKSTGASDGNKDDYVMAAMIALFASHENDWDENMGMIPIQQNLSPESAPYAMLCSRCGHRWGLVRPSNEDKCPNCGCFFVSAYQNINISLNPEQNPARDAIDLLMDASRSREAEYSLL